MNIFRKMEKINFYQGQLNKIVEPEKEIERKKEILEKKIEEYEKKECELFQKKNKLLSDLEEKGFFYCEDCNILYESSQLQPKLKKEEINGKLIQGSEWDGIYEKIEKLFAYFKCPKCNKLIKILS